MLNKDRSQWNCPICSLSIPFNMLELDQHQINIVHAMSEVLDTDEILIDENGSWLARHQPISRPPPNSLDAHTVPGHLSNHNHQVQPQMQPNLTLAPSSTAKSTGIYHPQPMGNMITQTRQQPAWESQQELAPSGPMPVRRPASAISGQPVMPVRRPTSSSPLAKKPYAGQFVSNTASFNGSRNQQLLTNENTDDLSPLAAMERTIIQHEQQMGPPPFDPSNLTASPVRAGPVNAQPCGANQSLISSSPSSSAMSSAASLQPTHLGSQMSPQKEVVKASFSPASQAPGTPVNIVNDSQRLASPQHQAQSPGQQLQVQGQLQTSSTPMTPSSSLLANSGPETPATPSNCQQQGGGSSVSVVAPSNQQVLTTSNSSAVDHQPLSNGSASAGSITSSSTMTPSGQSLGSVGMGGDSRCGTAPLPATGSLSLDDLMMPGGLGGPNNAQFKQSGPNTSSISLEGDKSEILMNKLMMDSEESLLRGQHGQHGNELALALEDAEWRQQLDRGKSQHLANFLNEPMMKRQRHQQDSLDYHQQQQHQHQEMAKSLTQSQTQTGNSVEADESHNTSPSQANLEDFSNYLDTDTADDGAGLPPDDSILDLFER